MQPLPPFLVSLDCLLFLPLRRFLPPGLIISFLVEQLPGVGGRDRGTANMVKNNRDTPAG
jgi:hypothetical protein